MLLKTVIVILAPFAVAVSAWADGMLLEEKQAWQQAIDQRLLANRDKLEEAFNAYDEKFPVQTVYYAGLFSSDFCGNPKPSVRLRLSAGINAFMKTADGKKVLTTTARVAAWNSATPEKKQWCAAIRELVAEEEAKAAHQ